MDKRDEHCTRYRSLIESISIQTRIGEKDMEKRKRWTGIRDKGGHLGEIRWISVCIPRGKWWVSTLRAVNAFHSLRED